jgi:phage terminase small subunit
MDSKILVSIDRIELTRLSNAIDGYQYHMEQVNIDPKRGIVQYQNGSNINGHIGAMNHYSKIIDSLGKKYGLDQESREKLLAFRNKKDEKDDPFSNV